MSSYVLSFRSQPDRTPSAEEETAWMQWFQTIGASISDFGHRVGQARRVGGSSGGDQLSGYVVVNAESLDAAARLAGGCPGLAHGGVVEVGEVVEG